MIGNPDGRQSQADANIEAKEARQDGDESGPGPAVHPLQVMARRKTDQPEGHVPSEGMRQRIEQSKEDAH